MIDTMNGRAGLLARTTAGSCRRYRVVLPFTTSSSLREDSRKQVLVVIEID